MSPKVSEDHQTERRDQILNAAVTCFAKNGFHKTSMKEICQEAELSPGAVYSYFSSKDEIIESVYQICEQENINIFQQTQDHSGSMQEQVEFSLSGFKKLLEDKKSQPWIRADLMFRGEALTNPTLMKLGKANYQTVIDELYKLVDTWQEKGEISPELDTKATAQLLFSMVNDVGFQKMLDPNMDIDAYFKSLIAIVMGNFKTD